jgi:hypothetical protein
VQQKQSGSEPCFGLLVFTFQSLWPCSLPHHANQPVFTIEIGLAQATCSGSTISLGTICGSVNVFRRGFLAPFRTHFFADFSPRDPSYAEPRIIRPVSYGIPSSCYSYAVFELQWRVFRSAPTFQSLKRRPMTLG